MAKPKTTRTLAGSCLCGAVRYRVRNEFKYAMNCHCSQCRRVTGSAFKPFAGIERKKLRVTKGADRLGRNGSKSNHDAFRKRCGSLLYSLINDDGAVHVTLGTLIDDPTIRPSRHIYVGSKAPWFTITDTLPQHAELP